MQRQQQPECCISGRTCAPARSLACLTIINVVAYSLSPLSLSLVLRSTFVPFISTHLTTPSTLSPPKLLECKIRLPAAYVGRKASAQSTSEREREEEKSLPMLFFSLSLHLIFSKYTIRSGYSSFVSHSLAYIFKHRRRPPSRALCFFFCASLFSLSLSLCLSWSSSSQMRFIYSPHSCS